MAEMTVVSRAGAANPVAPAERIGDLIVLPRGFVGASRDIAAASDLVRSSFSATDQDAPGRWLATETQLAALPARNPTDIAVKILHGLFEIAPALHGDRIAADLSCFPCDSISELLLGALADVSADPFAAENPELVAAFTTFRDAFHQLKTLDDDPDGQVADPLYQVMDAADDGSPREPPPELR